ncbi:hypothetical protein C7E18_23885, partial [Stenotrophomonas maltophilia]
SDNNEGNPRWVPLWTSVWLPHGHHGPVHPGPRPAFGTPVGPPSDNNEGNPRWVPLWTSVWLPHGHHGPVHPGPR